MISNIERLFLARAAQTAYNHAGYEKSEAIRKAQQVAEYVQKHLDECRRQFKIEDEIELSYRVAQARLDGILSSGIFTLSELEAL